MLIGLAVLLVALNALFVLMEYSLVRVRPSRIEVLARRGSWRAQSVQDMLSRLDDYLAACQVGITILALALGWLGEPAVADVLERHLEGLMAVLPPAAGRALSFCLSLAVLSWFQIVFGELIPRGIGIHKAETIALWGAPPLRIFAALLRWPVRFLSASSSLVLRLMGYGKFADAEHTVTVDEMRVLLGETQEKGAMPLERLMLLENLFDFGSAKVEDAMRAPERIIHLSLERSWKENLEIIRAKRYSRYPLCERGLDSVIGCVHVKDLALREDGGAEPDLKRLRRDVFETTLGEPLERLLKIMPDRGHHLAIVRDGLNRVAGLITLEDILEELVGEIHDEFDRPGAGAVGELFKNAVVDANLPPSDRRAAIGRLLGKLVVSRPGILNERAAFEAVWDRELKFTSAVGKGVLIPHARLPGLQDAHIAVGRFVKGAPFPTPDGVPARIVFLVLSPAESPVVQLRVLQRIASLVTNENVRRKLWRAKSDEQLLEVLRTADTLLAT